MVHIRACLWIEFLGKLAINQEHIICQNESKVAEIKDWIYPLDKWTGRPGVQYILWLHEPHPRLYYQGSYTIYHTLYSQFSDTNFRFGSLEIQKGPASVSNLGTACRTHINNTSR